MIFAETDRLRLRSFEERDLPFLSQTINNWDVVKWMGFFPLPCTQDFMRQWLERLMASEAEGKPEGHIVADKKTDEAFGFIGFHPLDRAAGARTPYEVFYWLGKPYWGLGLMTEAMNASVAWAMTRYWISNLIATTNLQNMRSQQVLKKAGFLFDGLGAQFDGFGQKELAKWFYPKTDK